MDQYNFQYENKENNSFFNFSWTTFTPLFPSCQLYSLYSSYPRTANLYCFLCVSYHLRYQLTSFGFRMTLVMWQHNKSLRLSLSLVTSLSRFYHTLLFVICLAFSPLHIEARSIFSHLLYCFNPVSLVSSSEPQWHPLASSRSLALFK